MPFGRLLSAFARLLTPVFSSLSRALSFVTNNLADHVFAPIWHRVFWPVLRVVGFAVSRAARGVATCVEFAWTRVISPAAVSTFNFFHRIITALADHIFVPLWLRVREVANVVGRALSAAAHAAYRFLSWALAPVRWLLHQTGLALLRVVGFVGEVAQLLGNAFGPLLRSIGTHTLRLLNAVLTPVFRLLSAVLSRVFQGLWFLLTRLWRLTSPLFNPVRSLCNWCCKKKRVGVTERGYTVHIPQGRHIRGPQGNLVAMKDQVWVVFCFSFH